ncbi:uncharacterized protein [Diabrotica undecimpunctata]|uniref:uncharacterized protein n=1 Tax=Diabrotica undecimpunctata TaxID=50387 RepID=UPI003B6423BB
MFSSPTVQIYLSENVDSHIQRKQGNNHLSRKPFIDRSVNGKSPQEKNMKKNLPGKDSLIKQKISPDMSKVVQEDNLNGEDFIYSGKTMKDSYNDIWPSFRLDKEDIIKILRDYSYPPKTPPPFIDSDFDDFKPTTYIEPEFIEMLPKDICTVQAPVILDESFEVDMPDLQTFEDLDLTF